MEFDLSSGILQFVYFLGENWRNQLFDWCSETTKAHTIDMLIVKERIMFLLSYADSQSYPSFNSKQMTYRSVSQEVKLYIQ